MRSADALRAGVAALAVLACAAEAPAPPASPTPPRWCTSVPLPRADLTLKSDIDGSIIHRAREPECRALELRAGRTTLHLAVAATEAQREHGLMNVPFVPASQGMLFAFADGDAARSFWMKDTIAPLDMVFVREDGTIESIAADVPATKPGTPDGAVATRKGLGKYVIELGAGESARLGLRRGLRLRIPAIPAE